MYIFVEKCCVIPPKKCNALVPTSAAGGNIEVVVRNRVVSQKSRFFFARGVNVYIKISNIDFVSQVLIF